MSTTMHKVMGGEVKSELQRCVHWALAGIHREFPCQLPLLLEQPTLFRKPRELTPAFYGCFDWHSAVHSHWLLVRCLVLNAIDGSMAESVRSAISENLTDENLAAEYRFLSHPLRTSFERPYGLAWLLQLASELRQWHDPLAAEWGRSLASLEQLAAERFEDWLPKLRGPVRTGEHGQTAFALGLLADWAEHVGHTDLQRLVWETAIRFHGDDENLPLHLEPSAHDFLSPSLAAADLLRRVLDPDQFSTWFSAALPGFPFTRCLRPVPLPTNVHDGRIAHLVGLNFSRAWMLNGIAQGLPLTDERRAVIVQLAREHLEIGLPMLACDEYSVTHWVGSFATYALTMNQG